MKQELKSDIKKVYNFEMKLADVAKKHGFSKMWASKLFVKRYGMTFTEHYLSTKSFGIDDAGKSRFIISLPSETRDRIKKESRIIGITMNAFIMKCISDHFNSDAWSKIENELF